MDKNTKEANSQVFYKLPVWAETCVAWLGERSEYSQRRLQGAMKDRIRYSLIYVGVLAALFAVYFTSKVFEDEMTSQLKASLQEKSHLVEVAYESLLPSQDSLGGITKAQLLLLFQF